MAIDDHVCACGCPVQNGKPYFLFPTNENLCRQWINFVRDYTNKEPQLNQYLQLCSRHFKDTDFIKVFLRFQPEKVFRIVLFFSPEYLIDNNRTISLVFMLIAQ